MPHATTPERAAQRWRRRGGARHRRVALATWIVSGLALSASACVDAPIEWEGPATLVAETGGAASFESAPSPATEISDPDACLALVRHARGAGSEVHAVWWRVRPGGSALLLSARSPDGGATWERPVPVDSTDVGTDGCDRPAPAIVVDPHTGYVHVVYSLAAPEGSGVFFSHSMDAGAMFHAPVPIVYGDRHAAAGIDARGDTVAVAFEDPNSATPRIGLALSHTSGHIFEYQTFVSAAASPGGSPLVSVRPPEIVVAWRPTPSMGGVAGQLFVRRGHLR
jgi:hypothetical protein